MEYKYIYCTVAVGEKYFKSACEFAKKLNEISNTHEVLIVTDQEHEDIINCVFYKIEEGQTKFYPNGCFNFNLKYLPIQLCSEMDFDFVFYFDADWRIYEKYSEDKIIKFLEYFNQSKYDFIFERPHGIGAGKRNWNSCFWRHKIEPYGLNENDDYDNGHVCNEQFLAFKNNDKLKIFCEKWSERNKFSLDNNIWPFAEGLEIGMSSIDAKMEFTWDGLNIMNSCFLFYSLGGPDPITRF